MSHQNDPQTGYGALLVNPRFQSFLWTQFLGAFNDNVYKMIVSVGAVELAANQKLGATYLALAGAIFVIPFLLFAGYAGQIADRFSKTRVLQITKVFEMVIMVIGAVALRMHSVELLLVVLFLLAMQANFFSPAKYGILPEMLRETQLTRANGLLELSTFAAIVLGTSVGAFLFARWKGEPLVLGGMLLGIAVIGSFTSLFIPKLRASGSREQFHWNPFQEVWIGTKRIYRNRALWLTVLGISYFWFLGALFQLTTILVGSETMHLSDPHTGLLVTALAVGIGFGSLAAGWVSGDRVEVGLVPCGAALMGIGALGVGFSHSFTTVAVWLATTGFAGGLFIVPLNAYLQDYAEPHEKGRLLATNNFLNMVGVVLASGFLYVLHDRLHWQPSSILVGLGILTLTGTIYIIWLVPAAMVRLGIWSVTQLFFRVRVVGAENLPKTGGALIVSNHVSYADAILIGCATPRFIRFLMWQPIYENKWLHPFCKLLQAIPLPTRSPKESLRALRHARTELENGQLVCIFPEGELTRTSHVKPFERGVELITRGLGSTPVIPVYLDGLWGHALSLKGGRVFGASGLRLRHSVTVYIGEPIEGEISAERLHQRVLEIGTEAAEYRKSPTTTLSRQFVQVAKDNWSSPAMLDSTGKQATFGEALTAALLLKKSIHRQCAGSDCVGLLLPTSVGGALANLGVTLAGKIAVNLNFTAGEDAMRHAIEKCGIKTILSSRVFLQKANLPDLPGIVFLEDLFSTITPIAKLVAGLASRFLPARVLVATLRPEAPAAVIFSSGSTGTPKGVVLSHWNLVANVQSTAQVYSVGSADCMLGVLPFFHSFGYTYTLWFPLLNGFKVVYHSNPMDAKIIGELAGEHHPTIFLATPTFCLGYLRKCTREQLGGIRYLLVGAEKLRPSFAEAFVKKFGVTPLEGYGCTEMGPVVSVNGSNTESLAYRAGSAGRPLPNVSVRIVDPDTFAPLTVGETGLLLVAGPSRMQGYLGDSGRTSEAFRDGYYVTGELAQLDHEGFLHITGRLARFSKIGGEMVSHLKIEETIDSILGEHCCVVTGIPDDQRGERIAVLMTRRDIPAGDLWKSLSATDLPRLWIPKRENIYPVDAIPMLGTGKIDLRATKARAIELAQPILVGAGGLDAN